jgi:hypothetical protein
MINSITNVPSPPYLTGIEKLRYFVPSKNECRSQLRNSGVRESGENREEGLGKRRRVFQGLA